MRKLLSVIGAMLLLSSAILAATATSISQYGITWTFDKAYEVGQFCTGDWWVLGPVQITGITPAPGGGRNGSVINPVPGFLQGYDSRGSGYSAGLGVTLPANLPVNASLISTISDLNAAGGSNAVYLTTAAVLTCLLSAPPAGSFRPAYCGTAKQLYNASQLQRQLLPKLATVDNTPAISDIAGRFKRVWLDHQFEWSGGQTHPAENLPNYGRELAALTGEAALLLLLNYTDAEKETLLINFVQVGIDNYGAVENGGMWNAGGGWPQGRKYPIMFAGYILNESAMLHVGDRSQPPVTPALFGDDYQTFYITQSDIDMIHTDMGGVVNAGRYVQSQLGVPEWGSVHWYPGHAGEYDVAGWWDDGYRYCCTANSWSGYILATQILGLKDAWHWNAIFDYTDRYQDIMMYAQNDWHRFGWSAFQKNMWTTYRTQYGCTWVLDTPRDAMSSGHLDCSKCLNQCPPDRAVRKSAGAMPALQVIIAPNPMHNNITLTTPACARSTKIKAAIYTENGTLVRQLGTLPGQNRLVWDRKDRAGNPVQPGIYLFSITIDNRSARGKIMVVDEQAQN